MRIITKVTLQRTNPSYSSLPFRITKLVGAIDVPTVSGTPAKPGDEIDEASAQRLVAEYRYYEVTALPYE